ncbi:MAG: hypothetical protein HRU40_11580 [Saprospiraceae bacterium]|nr:hypothetical protein [Saprospiraceae bacterium]
MKYTRILLLLILSFSILQIAYTQDAKKVLFVGNSYTYFWNLHLQVEAMVQQNESHHIQVTASTAGGSNLGQHWRAARGLKSRELIQSGAFEKVILQDHSRRAIDAPDSLMYYGQLLADAAQAKGADVYLYVTWARKWDPYMQAPILKGYQELAQKTGAYLMPVGPAWARARELRPDLELYDPDGSHPSSIGTYLTACVVYGMLTGESPVGLSERVALGNPGGLGFLFLNRMTSEDALFCQKVAEETLNQFQP